MVVGQVWPRAVRRPRTGEGHGGRVPCQRRGVPVLEKATASDNLVGEGKRRGTQRRLCELRNVIVFFLEAVKEGRGE